jgi:nicotinate-nucleotide adenylyltransferase
VCAQEACDQLALDRVLLVPVNTPPHKVAEDDPGVEVRVALCELAVAGDERFAVSDMELRRSGPSFTLDTLKTLSTRAPQDELVLILGGDIAAGLTEWHEPEQVLELARVAIADRRGTTRAAVDRTLTQLRGGDQARFFAMPRIGVSSTMLRRRVADGRPIRYFVPDQVEEYIRRHRLYSQKAA